MSRFPQRNMESIEGFYERFNQLEKKAGSESAARRGLIREGFQHVRMSPAERAEYNRLRATAQRLEIFNRQVRQIEASKLLSAQEKRRKLDGVYLRMLDAARRALGKQRMDAEPLVIRE